MDLNNYIVTIRNGTKRITLQRFLLSKIAYGKVFSEVELAALFHNQLWLQTKCSTDVDFQKKFGDDLESVTLFLKEANFSRGFTNRAADGLRQKLKAQPWDFLIPERNLPQLEAQLRNSIVTRWRRPAGVEINRLPPEKHIGKGYRDHGTAQRPEFDASPTWQEVASEVSQIDRQLEEMIHELERPEPDIEARLDQLAKASELIERKDRIVNQGSSRAAKKA